MSKITYVIRLAPKRYSVVWVDENRRQSTTPLTADMRPADTAFGGNTNDNTILCLARHPAGQRFRSLLDVAEVHGMTEREVKRARTLGRLLQRQNAA